MNSFKIKLAIVFTPLLISLPIKKPFPLAYCFLSILSFIIIISLIFINLTFLRIVPFPITVRLNNTQQNMDFKNTSQFHGTQEQILRERVSVTSIDGAKQEKKF